MDAVLGARQLRVAQALVTGKPEWMHQRLDYGFFVSMRYRYVFSETPKAAASSTKAALWLAEGLGQLPASLHKRPPDDPRPSPTRLPAGTAMQALFSDDFLRFVIWRDPVSRLCSAYTDKIVGLGPNERRWVGPINPVEGPPPTFRAFAEFVCSQPDDGRDPHWRSQCRLNLHAFVRYHRVIPLDTYVTGLAEVLRACGVPMERWHDLSARLNAIGSDERIRVDADTEAMIRHAYRRDYQIVEAVPTTGRRAV